MKFTDILRLTPGGAALSGIPIIVYSEDGDAELDDTLESGSDGSFTYEKDYGQEPFYWVGENAVVVRKNSSRATGMQGPNFPIELIDVYRAMGDGITSGAFTVTPTGTRQVTVTASGALVQGLIQLGYNTVTPAAGSANVTIGGTRIDTLVLEVVPLGQTKEGLGTLKIIEGTVVSTPKALTQTSAFWQFPIRDLTLANGGTSYVVSTDRREYLFADPPPRPETLIEVTRNTTPVDITSTAGASVSGFAAGVTLSSGVTYDIVSDVIVWVENDSGTMEVAVWIGATANIPAYSTTRSPAGEQQLISRHHLTVVGAGVTYEAGLIARRSSSGVDADVLEGITTIVAVPRSD